MFSSFCLSDNLPLPLFVLFINLNIHSIDGFVRFPVLFFILYVLLHHIYLIFPLFVCFPSFFFVLYWFHSSLFPPSFVLFVRFIDFVVQLVSFLFLVSIFPFLFHVLHLPVFPFVFFFIPFFFFILLLSRLSHCHTFIFLRFFLLFRFPFLFILGFHSLFFIFFDPTSLSLPFSLPSFFDFFVFGFLVVFVIIDGFLYFLILTPLFICISFLLFRFVLLLFLFVFNHHTSVFLFLRVPVFFHLFLFTPFLLRFLILLVFLFLLLFVFRFVFFLHIYSFHSSLSHIFLVFFFLALFIPLSSYLFFLFPLAHLFLNHILVVFILVGLSFCLFDLFVFPFYHIFRFLMVPIQNPLIFLYLCIILISLIYSLFWFIVVLLYSLFWIIHNPHLEISLLIFCLSIGLLLFLNFGHIFRSFLCLFSRRLDHLLLYIPAIFIIILYFYYPCISFLLHILSLLFQILVSIHIVFIHSLLSFMLIFAFFFGSNHSLQIMCILSLTWNSSSRMYYFPLFVLLTLFSQIQNNCLAQIIWNFWIKSLLILLLFDLLFIVCFLITQILSYNSHPQILIIHSPLIFL